MKRVTIKDIAQKTNFSKSTVSRVLMNDPNVKPDTRERILEALRESNYRTNELARGMVCGNLPVVMIIAGDITSYFYGAAVKEIERMLYKEGFLVMVCNSEYDSERELNYLSMAEQFRVSGVILMTAIESERLNNLIRSMNCAVISMNRYLKGIEIDAIVQDNYTLAYKGTQRLLAQGHRKIVHISSQHMANTTMDRRRGYLDAMRDSGLGNAEHMVRYGDHTWQSGYEIAMEFAREGIDYSAVFLLNDMMTTGFLKALEEQGKQIRDYSFLCFDYSPAIASLPVRVETIGCTAAMMGQKAGERMLQRLRGDETPPQRIVMPEFYRWQENSDI